MVFQDFRFYWKQNKNTRTLYANFNKTEKLCGFWFCYPSTAVSLAAYWESHPRKVLAMFLLFLPPYVVNLAN